MTRTPDPAPHILIVDDSPLTLACAEDALTDAGYRVRTATDLSALEAAVGGERFDLVLMDVVMPEAYGDDVAAMLRDVRGLDAPILLLSALDEEDLAARARDAGLDGAISKRAGVATMVARVREQLGDRGGPPATGRDTHERAYALTARRRLRRAQDLVAGASADASRHLARELQLLAGESAFLGYGEIAALVRRSEQEAAHWPADPAAGDAVDMTLAAIACLLPAPAEPLVPPRHALIVADSVSQGWLLRDVLEHAGYETAVVVDPTTPTGEPPDIILCSLTSPARLDAAVREVRARSTAPLLLVAVETAEQLAAESARVGADGYVGLDGGVLEAVAAIRRIAERPV